MSLVFFLIKVLLLLIKTIWTISAGCKQYWPKRTFFHIFFAIIFFCRLNENISETHNERSWKMFIYYTVDFKNACEMIWLMGNDSSCEIKYCDSFKFYLKVLRIGNNFSSLSNRPALTRFKFCSIWTYQNKCPGG